MEIKRYGSVDEMTDWSFEQRNECYTLAGGLDVFFEDNGLFLCLEIAFLYQNGVSKQLVAGLLVIVHIRFHLPVMFIA